MTLAENLIKKANLKRVKYMKKVWENQIFLK